MRLHHATFRRLLARHNGYESATGSGPAACCSPGALLVQALRGRRPAVSSRWIRQAASCRVRSSWTTCCWPRVDAYLHATCYNLHVDACNTPCVHRRSTFPVHPASPILPAPPGGPSPTHPNPCRGRLVHPVLCGGGRRVRVCVLLPAGAAGGGLAAGAAGPPRRGAAGGAGKGQRNFQGGAHLLCRQVRACVRVRACVCAPCKKQQQQLQRRHGLRHMGYG